MNKHHLVSLLSVVLAVSLLGGSGWLFFVSVKELRSTSVDTQGAIGDLRLTLQSANAFIKDAQASLDDNYYDVKATIETVAVTAKDTDDLIHDLRATTVGGKDTAGVEREGMLVEATALLHDSRAAIAAFTNDLSKLTDTADATLAPLSEVFRHITALTDTLNVQIAAGGDGVKTTSEQLTKTLGDLDKLIADPDIQKILASSADASKHLAGAAESVDIALAPWRKKVSQLKMIIEKALGMVRVVYAF